MLKRLLLLVLFLSLVVGGFSVKPTPAYADPISTTCHLKCPTNCYGRCMHTYGEGELQYQVCCANDDPWCKCWDYETDWELKIDSTGAYATITNSDGGCKYGLTAVTYNFNASCYAWCQDPNHHSISSSVIVSNVSGGGGAWPTLADGGHVPATGAEARAVKAAYYSAKNSDHADGAVMVLTIGVLHGACGTPDCPYLNAMYWWNPDIE